jgi:hypothetical protein
VPQCKKAKKTMLQGSIDCNARLKDNPNALPAAMCVNGLEEGLDKNEQALKG